jgi:hypothetical protein
VKRVCYFAEVTQFDHGAMRGDVRESGLWARVFASLCVSAERSSFQLSDQVRDDLVSCVGILVPNLRKAFLHVSFTVTLEFQCGKGM